MPDDAAARLRHDIRSPLTVIAGFARLLTAESLGDEERREYAGRIEAACREIERLVAEFDGR